MPGQTQQSSSAEPAYEEVRVAMALNGGVSLAVWMGGCAAELDRARRSEQARHEEWRIYDALCECFGRRLVIDILTGSSAGGINGALLGAAMVKGRRLDPSFLRNSWLDLGDLSNLLHGSADREPRSLMRGDLFHQGLLDAFNCVLGTGKAAPGHDACKPKALGPKSVPSLDVTMTDTIGVERRFRDTWGNVLRAKEHRPRFRFRRGAQFTADALAAAARTSASFPIAFEPWPVVDAARTLAGLPHPTFGIDGGLLDNAPIRAALELIPTKSARSSVRRYVCYMNGDPPPPAREEAARTAPTLRQIGGYVVGLPREAPFVDHLYAIQRAVERPRLASDTQERLLRMDLDELHGVALALLDTYRRRRAGESLEELLPEPGYAAVVDRLLDGTNGRLPWIPDSLDRPREDEWHWGIRPAERILHLLLDLLRPALAKAVTKEDRVDLLGARKSIHDLLADLGSARDEVIDEGLDECLPAAEQESPIDQLEDAVALANERAPEAYAAVKAAAGVLLAALLKHPLGFEAGTAEALFGPQAGSAIDEHALTHFFRRVLSIEVVRRAFTGEADIESAQELHFVQLTPAAPSPIFNETPFSLPRCLTGASKLTGIGLHHFAGFYRRSWRANDFMWGRLDAAARIVDLLLDAPSPDLGIGAGEDVAASAKARSKLLAEAVLGKRPAAEEEGREQREREALVSEALEDAAAAQLPVEPEKDGSLQERLRATIEAELIAAGAEPSLTRLPFTRAVFQRAAQHEIVREELNVIRRESLRDREQGSAATPLKLGDLKGDDEANPEMELKAVRKIYADGDSLPGRLVDEEEAVSDMGLRTIVKAAFVALAAARGAKLPMAKFFGYVRAPLLAVAGTVATNWLHRLTLVLGFWTAAVYLTSRLVSATDTAATLASVELWPTVTAFVAALGVVGIAAVPGLRAWRHVKSVLNGALALALVGSAGGLATILACTAGGLDSVEQIVLAPGADTPSTLVVTLPLIAIGALSVARLPVPGLLSPALAKLLDAVRKSSWLWVPLVASFAPLGFYAGRVLANALDDRAWQAISSGVALAGAPVAASIAVAIWELRRQPRKAAPAPQPAPRRDRGIP